MSAAATLVNSVQAYIDHVNPQWVPALSLLQMRTEYGLCSGAELHTSNGDVILDFLSGYCVHNTGHNHPAIIEALHAELDRRGPVMLQSHVPDLAGGLAARLCKLGGSCLGKAFFASSGSEGVEARSAAWACSPESCFARRGARLARSSTKLVIRRNSGRKLWASRGAR
jgi:ornithine--oxo-acid transaminase